MHLEMSINIEDTDAAGAELFLRRIIILYSKNLIEIVWKKAEKSFKKTQKSTCIYKNNML